MIRESIVSLVNRQDWLERVADVLQRVVGSAYSAGGESGRAVKNFLHGTWMGHPLHPALTDIPIGAWSAAVGLDALEVVTGRDELAVGADAAIGVGILGAVGAAAAGLTDYHDVGGQARRVGAAHALLNVGALGLFSWSLACRLRGARNAGRALAAAGEIVTLISGHLGGELVFGRRIGVDHTAGVEPPERFTRVIADAALPNGEPRRVQVDGVPVVLVRAGNHVYALAETCAHQGGPLAEGTVDDDSITCPWHASRYALADGRVLDGPSTHPQPCFATRVRDGHIEVGPMSAEPEGGQLHIAA
jgi:nitrite reductase/ring-hydroxylating ferredoxin subunit/uncharacterized membrane protein